MKVSDSIVDEVRAVRDALARESDDDMEKIVEKRTSSPSTKGSGSRHTLPPKATNSAKRAS